VVFCDKEFSERKINQEIIENILRNFVGPQEQIPPMFSAKKVKGQRLYDLARKGIEIERKASKINIYKIEYISYEAPLLKIKIKCSSGTYIRSIAFDFGRALGCGAYLEALERTEIGKFRIEDSFLIEELGEGNWEQKILKNAL